jgi:Zn-dependent protease
MGMRWSYKIVTLFGIPVRVHISLLVFLGFVAVFGGGMRGLIMMIAVFGSVVLHELGHALTARANGLPIGDISLYPFGGMARLLAAPKTTGVEIGVAAAGPVVSLILGLGFWFMAHTTANEELWLMAQVNLILGGFNLLPALPMDGGRILRAILARKLGFYRATRIAAQLARWIAMVMAGVGLYISGWLIVIAAFLIFMSIAEEGMAQMRQYMGDPGYQDAPGPYGPPHDPLPGNSGDQGSDTEWEVLDDDAPGPRSARPTGSNRQGP